MKRIFVSSVQREFAQVRKQLKTHLSRNPAYRRLFESFVFEEDVIVTDRRTDEVYLDELAQCDLYLGIIGNEYGFEDKDGVSPTEREYDEATRLGLPRLMFVLGRDNSFRHPKEAAFLGKVSSDLIRAMMSAHFSWKLPQRLMESLWTRGRFALGRLMLPRAKGRRWMTSIATRSRGLSNVRGWCGMLILKSACLRSLFLRIYSFSSNPAVD